MWYSYYHHLPHAWYTCTYIMYCTLCMCTCTKRVEDGDAGVCACLHGCVNCVHVHVCVHGASRQLRKREKQTKCPEEKDDRCLWSPLDGISEGKATEWLASYLVLDS